MHRRNYRGQLLIGALTIVTMLSWGGTSAAGATTLDLAAMSIADCGVTDGLDMALTDSSDLTLLELEATTPAPNTPDDKQPKTCRINGNCWKPAYCFKEMGTCKGQGVCKAKPDSCTKDADPVCGCNHKTYSNACLAAKAGMNVIHKGECEKKSK